MNSLPMPLRVQPVLQGSEETVVKPYWKGIVTENNLVDDLSNGYEVGFLGPNIPDVVLHCGEVHWGSTIHFALVAYAGHSLPTTEREI